ncbi:hypothetical protein BaRGS_00028111 [Batillaria attramentaria]|uniref:Uncharacterized protein n=1 Tax=Batillaria attramentaria TaxID=370345 RepID=A0ABD0K0K5_9CAEN
METSDVNMNTNKGANSERDRENDPVDLAELVTTANHKRYLQLVHTGSLSDDEEHHVKDTVYCTVPTTGLLACSVALQLSWSNDASYDNLSSPTSPTFDDSASAGEMPELSADPVERERQMNEWKEELEKVEGEITMLRQVLGSKVRRATELKRNLGITPFKEFKQDLQSGLQTIKDSSTLALPQNLHQVAGLGASKDWFTLSRRAWSFKRLVYTKSPGLELQKTGLHQVAGLGASKDWFTPSRRAWSFKRLVYTKSPGLELQKTGLRQVASSFKRLVYTKSPGLELQKTGLRQVASSFKRLVYTKSPGLELQKTGLHQVAGLGASKDWFTPSRRAWSFKRLVYAKSLRASKDWFTPSRRAWSFKRLVYAKSLRASKDWFTPSRRAWSFKRLVYTKSPGLELQKTGLRQVAGLGASKDWFTPSRRAWSFKRLVYVKSPGLELQKTGLHQVAGLGASKDWFTLSRRAWSFKRLVYTKSPGLELQKTGLR